MSECDCTSVQCIQRNQPRNKYYHNLFVKEGPLPTSQTPMPHTGLSARPLSEPHLAGLLFPNPACCLQQVCDLGSFDRCPITHWCRARFSISSDQTQPAQLRTRRVLL